VPLGMGGDHSGAHCRENSYRDPRDPYRGGMGLFRMIIRPFLRLLLIIPVFVSKTRV